MNKTKSQSGSAHSIIIMVLCVALIGSLGFVYYQNFIQNKDNTSKTNIEEKDDTTIATPSSTKTTPVVDPITVVNDFLTSYIDFINPVASGHTTDAEFAAQSTALTDNYKDSIVTPSGMVYVSPISLVQDIFVSFRVGNATTTSTSSSVPVTLTFGSNSTSNVVYNLVLVKNEWKINGVSKA